MNSNIVIRLVLDLSFLLPEPETEDRSKAEPSVNAFAYSPRYGSDTLVPVYCLELNLERQQ